jgi:isopenicillin-N N-acyltransferase like protein
VSRWRKWRRRLLWLTGVLVALWLLAWGTMYGLMWHWVARPPALAELPAITKLAPETRGGRVYLGRDWFGQREGLNVLYLTGTPFEMGYANGMLTQNLIHHQEDSVLQLLNQVAPYRWTRFVLKFLVTYKNRHLSDYITPDLQMEMLGLVRGCPDTHPEMGPGFNRILNYHAAQDISYMMMNSPLIHRGCTAFGAWGPRTRDGHLLVGRNFDWEAHPVFDEDRLVVICEPAEGIPFISLAWAGMAGCVSGMNRAGLAVTVNGAPSHLPDDAATPTCLVAREMLQYAHNIAEATEIVRRRRVFVSAQFLVASRADGKCVVIEKTPERMAVREPETGANTLVCANHYLTPELKDDPINEVFKRVDTSVPRFDRMTELLRDASAPLDAAACAAILRDRRLAGGGFAGNGHRSSLNPLIATHAVIMDLTGGIFRAARPPHQLGQFVAFDLNDPEKLLPEQAVAGDPLLAGDYELYLAAKAGLSDGWRALKAGDPARALQAAQTAEKNNPGFYQNAWLQAEALFRQGKYPEAGAACRRALAGQPALAGERRRIELLLTRTEAQK